MMLFIHCLFWLKNWRFSTNSCKGLSYPWAWFCVQQLRCSPISKAVFQKCSVKNDVLKNFAKFIGKLLYQSLFFNKVAGLRPAILLKKRLWHRYFSVNFAKFLRIPFFIEQLCFCSVIDHSWTFILYKILNFGNYIHLMSTYRVAFIWKKNVGLRVTQDKTCMSF